MIVNGNLKFHTLGAGQLENAVMERLATAPTGAAGRLYYNTTTNDYWYHDGTAWVKFGGAGDVSALQTEVDNIETSIGAAVDSNGEFDDTAFSTFTNVENPTSITNVLSQLDAAISGKDELAELEDVNLGTLPEVSDTEVEVLKFNNATQLWVNSELSFGNLSNVNSAVDGTPTGDVLAFDGTEWTAITPATFAGDIDLNDIGDVVITAATSGHVLYNNGTNWVNAAPGATSGVQGYDTGLANLATGGQGLVSMDGDTVAYRTLTAPAAGITVTDGNGVDGNPTLVLANDLAALEGLASTGYVVRTADGAATTRSIQGTAGTIVVTNGNGVSSDTSLTLDTVTQGTTGDFVKVTLDTFGRVTGNTPVVAADITTLVDATYVNISGDTMTGNLGFGGTHTVTSLAAPVADNDAATKAYVDAVAAGLSWKQAVRVATTANVALAPAPATIDGVTLASNDRVLVKDQTAPAENGIYVFDGTDLVRATDMDVAAEFAGATVFVTEGTSHADSGWTQTAEVATLGTTAVVWSQFSGSATYVWGVGLESTGNTVNINLGSGIFEGPTDAVGIDLFDTTTGALILTTNGTTRESPLSLDGELYLLLNATGALAQDADGLRINASSVSNAMLVNQGVVTNGDTGTGTLNLGGALEIAGTSTQGITTAVAGSVFTISANDATDTTKGVASFSNADFVVTAGSVAIKTGGVSNTQLVNSTFTVTGTTGTDPVALGETLAFVGGSSNITTDMNAGTNTLTISWTAALNDLSDVSAAAPATSDLLTWNGSAWINATRATVLGTQILNNLSDVSVSHVDGHVVVSTGTNWVNQKIFHEYTGASAASHVVTHNIGTRYCNVTVVDSATHEVVIPQSIVFDSTTQLTVTFNTAVACVVIVMGVA